MRTSRRQFISRLIAVSLLPAVAEARVPGALPPLLAKVMEPGTDPAGYLVSEKYDGVRAMWDGRVLRFRSGRPVDTPPWFTARLPATPLDGELWLARGHFDELSGIVRKAPPLDADWRRVNYMLFENPGGDGTFEQRYARIRQLVERLSDPTIQAVAQERVADRAALQRRLDEVLRSGGEGLALHRADALYVTGRSDVLLKLKPIRDTEALVIGHVPGQGKYAGMLGALKVETSEGKRFRLGSGFSDAQRRNPPPIGATVTYAYRDFTPTGVPRFATFVAVREWP
jgi:DNA ligase 1